MKTKKYISFLGNAYEIPYDFSAKINNQTTTMSKTDQSFLPVNDQAANKKNSMHQLLLMITIQIKWVEVFFLRKPNLFFNKEHFIPWKRGIFQQKSTLFP